jgi:hypothetical protein
MTRLDKVPRQRQAQPERVPGGLFIPMGDPPDGPNVRGQLPKAIEDPGYMWTPVPDLDKPLNPYGPRWVTLPYPPNANHQWRTVRGVMLFTKEARANHVEVEE